MPNHELTEERKGIIRRAIVDFSCGVVNGALRRVVNPRGYEQKTRRDDYFKGSSLFGHYGNNGSKA